MMVNRFREFSAKNELYDQGDRILLAISGGIDSMVMAGLFLEAGISVGVAHANFQLRGQDSVLDEEFVERFCRKSGIEFFSRRFETKNYAEKKGLSVQMAARELRYAWFNEILEQKNYFAVATAHHLNDNLETVLLRWIKGTNLEMLSGIPVKKDNVIRPMLFLTRTEIESYARENKITWREDKSNLTDDYARNFIRHQLVPKLKELNPSIEKTFSDSLEKIHGSIEMMHRGLEQLRDHITRTEGKSFMIDKSLLSIMKNPAFICYEWLRPFGFEWDRCVQLAASLDSQPGKVFHSSTHEAVIDRDWIIVTPVADLGNDILIEEGQDKAALGVLKLFIREKPGGKIPDAKNLAVLDKGKLKFPLVWRRWRSGDMFFPLGLGHRKKLSDFLVDEKVSLSDKNLVSLLESDGQIIWVVGHRIDDRFKVTPATKKVLEFRVELT